MSTSLTKIQLSPDDQKWRVVCFADSLSSLCGLSAQVLELYMDDFIELIAPEEREYARNTLTSGWRNNGAASCLAHLLSDSGAEPVCITLLDDDTTDNNQAAKTMLVAVASPGPTLLCSNESGIHSKFVGQVNLDKNEVVHISNLCIVSKKLQSCKTYSEMISSFAESALFETERERFLEAFDADRLRALYNSGVTKTQMELDVIKGENEHSWIRLTMQCLKSGIQRQLCAYIYVENIHESKQREIELRIKSQQDPLTKLYNRLTASLKIDERLRERADDVSFAFMMLDLDSFKQINDSRGHACGDDVIKSVAAELTKISPQGSIIGRIGGDEFVTLIEAADHEAAELIARDMCERLYNLLHAYNSSASIGVVMSPKYGDCFEVLYPLADAALYRAKRRGRAFYTFYSSGMARPDDNAARNPLGREWLLDEMSDHVYVSDINTYEMLYMNKTARIALGITSESEYVGRKCYQVIYNSKEKCQFCNNDVLRRDRFYLWEEYNKNIGRYYMMKDRIVDWYGSPAHVQFATDITSREMRARRLEKQVDLEKFTVECMRSLFQATTQSEACSYLLRHIGMFFRAKHAYITQFDRHASCQVIQSQWFDSRLRQGRELFSEERLYSNDLFSHCFLTGERYALDVTDSLECDDQLLYSCLTSCGISCRRAVQLQIGGIPYGMLGLDDPGVFYNEFGILDVLGKCIAEKIANFQMADTLVSLGYPPF